MIAACGPGQLSQLLDEGGFLILANAPSRKTSELLRFVQGASSHRHDRRLGYALRTDSVFFEGDEQFTRNVLKRIDWLGRIKLGLMNEANYCSVLIS